MRGGSRSRLLEQIWRSFLKDLTEYIAFLSNSVFTIYSQGENFYLTAYSDAFYFSRALDRMHHDAARANFTSLLDWATYRITSAEFYLTQTIPPTSADMYYRAAEVARQDGSIRRRMPFHRPAFGGTPEKGKCTPAQVRPRQVFKSLVDKFKTLSYTERQALYERAQAQALWYFNFWIQLLTRMIKRTHPFYVTMSTEVYADLYFTNNPFTPQSTVVFFLNKYMYFETDVMLVPMDFYYAIYDDGKMIRLLRPTNFTPFLDVIMQGAIIEFY